MGSEMVRKNRPQPINTWLESLRPSVPSAVDEAEQIERANKDEAILVLLGKLAFVYWRPDFQPGQAKQLYLQYVDDLREFAMRDIVEAVEAHRRDGSKKFFPMPGELRAHITTPPAWDMISKRDHIHQRHIAAKEEFAAAVTKTRLRIGLANPKMVSAQ